jgi:hypothetical protein
MSYILDAIPIPSRPIRNNSRILIPARGSYQRGDILDKRRRLMQEWADFCEGGEGANPVANVVPIKAA